MSFSLTHSNFYVACGFYNRLSLKKLPHNWEKTPSALERRQDCCPFTQHRSHNYFYCVRKVPSIIHVLRIWFRTRACNSQNMSKNLWKISSGFVDFWLLCCGQMFFVQANAVLFVISVCELLDAVCHSEFLWDSVQCLMFSTGPQEQWL